MNKDSVDQSGSIEAANRTTASLKCAPNNMSEAMKLARQAVVKTQIQHMRIKRMGRSLRDRETDLIEDEMRWTDRTETSVSQSEQEALDCLAKRVRCRVRLTNIRERMLIHDALESELYSRWKEAEVWLEKLSEDSDELPDIAEATRALLALIEKTDCTGSADVGLVEVMQRDCL